MPTFVLRVWLPDRPGALGAVASRIGAVRGDLVGIEILETGGGRAIDELAVELPSEKLVPLLVDEVGQVDGVDVEEVRAVDGALPDPRLDALETAALLVQQTQVDDLLRVLTAEAQRDFAADWAVLVSTEDGTLLAGTGESPEPAWLAAFLGGSSSSATAANGDAGPDDVAFALFPGGALALVVGREGKAFRARERRQLLALAKVAGHRWTELTLAINPEVSAVS
ncbi:MAG: hypothetical protein JOZ68_11010 [Acidimicrobiia bacterium]|nr:hypothetical protein [Acidimicrobiia bacterium]MBV8984910.1 hypothetical protein [Acidimicrobiia bacterium]MBV9041529.1 hypothetical protein [Acidimicrobiia bacterium]